MPYTQVDLDAVRAARLKLAAGDRVVTVTVGGQTTEYAQVNISDLHALARMIEDDLARAAGGTHHVVASSSKGL
ncbi:MAG: gpW family head-tail joining protein [bacterium]